MNKRGFTLIEILAVIIIIGVLLLIAIPSVARYIENSRKSAYVHTIKNVLASAGANISKGLIEKVNKDTTYYVPNECIKTENGVAKSPYDEFDQAYIVVGWENNNYSFYWVSRDKSGNGIKDLKKIDDITEDDIEHNIPKDYIKTDKTIGNTKNINLLDIKDCTTLIDVNA